MARYLLGLRQPQPELPPGPEFVPVTKHEAHLRAGIAGGKRRAVAVVPAGRLLPAAVAAFRHPDREYLLAEGGPARAGAEVRGRDFLPSGRDLLHLVPPRGSGRRRRVKLSGLGCRRVRFGGFLFVDKGRD